VNKRVTTENGARVDSPIAACTRGAAMQRLGLITTTAAAAAAAALFDVQCVTREQHERTTVSHSAYTIT